MWRQRQRLEGHIYQPRNLRIAGNHQKLEEAKKDSSLEPLERAWA